MYATNVHRIAQRTLTLFCESEVSRGLITSIRCIVLRQTNCTSANNRDQLSERTMTSAYEATTECEQQQKATTPRASTKVHFDGRELDNSDNSIDMENTLLSLSREANLATDSSSSEQLDTEVNVLPGESFQEDLSAYDENTRKMAENTRKEENESERSADVSRINRSKRNEELINEKHKENSILNLSANNNIAPENTFTCHAKEDECIKGDKIEDQEGSKDQDQRNWNVLEIGVQERRMTCDSNAHARDNSRDFTAGDMRACYEKVAELGLDTRTETQNEGIEREIIIDRQDNDSFYDAVRSGDIKRVTALIASGCVQNLDEPDWNVSGDPPLLIAATNHCLPVLR